MLQKELAKRLRARYDTKMDGNEWLEVSSNGVPLCRIKYNGQYLSNADKTLSNEYRNKIADIQDEISTVREYVGLYEHAPQMTAVDVSDYRQLASFGDTVLAATYSEKNGFMFCTWKQNADGDSVFWGDYSPNYEYVKEAFPAQGAGPCQKTVPHPPGLSPPSQIRREYRQQKMPQKTGWYERKSVSWRLSQCALGEFRH